MRVTKKCLRHRIYRITFISMDSAVLIQQPRRETMNLFRNDNTEGYTDEQLAALNAEAAKRVPELMAEAGLSEDEAKKAFADEVAGR